MDLLVEGVSHGFGALPVLDRVSLEIASGEIVALLGPSGCGKSTLLGIAGGMVAPDAGRVRLRGEAPAACLNPLTYVFQDFALLPWRDVAGNVALPLEHHGLGAAERARRVDDALARIGLSDFRGAWPRQLSGGMRQRVGIARALVVEPAVLLMEDLLALWRQTRFTALYVTHNLAEALRLAHRVVVLSRRPGRVREVVEVPIPVEARGGPAAAATLAALHERLWALLRDEARDAEREIADAGAA